MSLYRKKPVVIQAHRLTPDTLSAVVLWCEGLAIGETCVAIHTLEGTMYASMGDYIIKGIQGEFYPCKSDIFEATYEAVTEDEA